MAGELLLIDGSTFCLSDGRGDLGDDGMQGLFAADVRHLSEWRLLLEDEPVRLLTSRVIGHASARIFGTAPGADEPRSPSVTVVRDRNIAGGFRETLSFENNREVEQRLLVKLIFAGDFADIFEVKANGSNGAPAPHDAPGAPGGATQITRDDDGVTLGYSKGVFHRATKLGFSVPFSLLDGGGCAAFDIVVPPRSRRELAVSITCCMSRGENAAASHPVQKNGASAPADAFLGGAPALITDSELLRHTYGQSLNDLAALRFSPTEDASELIPAAGLPWFMALFGRDSLITAYQALPFAPELARATLATLARYQASAYDDFRDSEPGKILHELRRGKLAALGEIPHTPYFGTHDATPLFVILLDEYERWSGDQAFARSMKGAALRALEWMQSDGDRDGDGYLEYETRSSLGLPNQCWKDSWDSIVDRRGRLAAAPIASCEIQGYAFDAKVRGARLCRELWGEPAMADRLEAEAANLKSAFNRDFYDEDTGTYVLALDVNKRRIDSVTSNIGHLLWSGIVAADRAGAVADRLMEPDMFNGWGVRTLSANEVAYNPVGYHTGSVWPHDTGMIAEGMRRYGFRAKASTLVTALIESAAFFAYRLPEVFAGFDRARTEMPVEYPTASSPQAWAAGTPLLALRTLLGLDAGATLGCDPALPETLGRTRLEGIQFRGNRVTAP